MNARILQINGKEILTQIGLGFSIFAIGTLFFGCGSRSSAPATAGAAANNTSASVTSANTLYCNKFSNNGIGFKLQVVYNSAKVVDPGFLWMQFNSLPSAYYPSSASANDGYDIRLSTWMETLNGTQIPDNSSPQHLVNVSFMLAAANGPPITKVTDWGWNLQTTTSPTLVWPNMLTIATNEVNQAMVTSFANNSSFWASNILYIDLNGLPSGSAGIDYSSAGDSTTWKVLHVEFINQTTKAVAMSADALIPAFNIDPNAYAQNHALDLANLHPFAGYAASMAAAGGLSVSNLSTFASDFCIFTQP